MNIYHLNNKRAPKKGGSAYFTSKQEREQERFNQYYSDVSTSKHKRPNRTAARKSKDRESKQFAYSLVLNNYEDLTKFKTFIRFLRKKPDISNLEIDETHLTYTSFDITERDHDIIHTMCAHYNMLNRFHAAIRDASARVTVQVLFTNKKIQISSYRELNRIIPIDDPGASVWSSIRRSAVVDTDFIEIENESAEKNIKELLTLITKNIKKPRFI